MSKKGMSVGVCMGNGMDDNISEKAATMFPADIASDAIAKYKKFQENEKMRDVHIEIKKALDMEVPIIEARVKVEYEAKATEDAKTIMKLELKIETLEGIIAANMKV